jgi:ubiquinone biosynthesis monooxygenase Coq7
MGESSRSDRVTHEAELVDRHLRVIHACEKGATGVYWGHRLVAWVLYRDLVAALTEMHAHEMQHYDLFGKLIAEKRSRKVFAPVLWCAGGIVYGFLTALMGRRAIWRSTAVIESIVEKELTAAAAFFEARDRRIYEAIQTILIDEVEHKERAAEASPGLGRVDAVVTPAAEKGAAVSKTLAERL